MVVLVGGIVADELYTRNTVTVFPYTHTHTHFPLPSHTLLSHPPPPSPLSPHTPPPLIHAQHTPLPTQHTDVPPQLRLQALQSVMLLIPDENREALLSLLTFLKEVSDHADINQVTTSILKPTF